MRSRTVQETCSKRTAPPSIVTKADVIKPWADSKPRGIGSSSAHAHGGAGACWLRAELERASLAEQADEPDEDGEGHEQGVAGMRAVDAFHRMARPIGTQIRESSPLHCKDDREARRCYHHHGRSSLGVSVLRSSPSHEAGRMAAVAHNRSQADGPCSQRLPPSTVTRRQHLPLSAAAGRIPQAAACHQLHRHSRRYCGVGSAH